MFRIDSVQAKFGTEVEGTIVWMGLHAVKRVPRLGIEMSMPVGLNDGSLSFGSIIHRYFKCAPKHGIFCAPANVAFETRAGTTSSV